jgi:Spy/CpxP family protein refolding chaperone
MRKYHHLALSAIAVSILTSGYSSGQELEIFPNPVGRLHLMQPIMGLESQTVRKELKLTEEQEQKIKPILEKLVEARAKVEFIREFVKLPREERQARQALRKIMNMANGEISTLLSEEQTARYKQICLWIQPGTALFCEEIITELKLVTVQRDALAAIYEKHQKKMLEIPSPTEGTIAEKQLKRREQESSLRKEFRAEIMGVLTNEQREYFEKMRGPKFEMDMSEFPAIVRDTP